MQDFRNLEVWRKAHELALAVYKATGPFPKAELYGLTSQLRRSAVSIPANLAEGCGRSSDADFARFTQIAVGSASELEYHLLIAKDLKMLPANIYDNLSELASAVKRMLISLLKKLRAVTNVASGI